jgi:OmcA/MtrC family decaheme c-type cytochrome
MFKRAARLAAIGLTIAAVGCSGSDGSQGPQGPQGNPGDPGTPGKDVTLAAKPESCTVCHTGAGGNHQAIYDAAKDASNLSAVVNDVVTGASSVVTVRFTVTYNGHLATPTEFNSFAQKRVAAVTYDSGSRKFDSNTVSFSGRFTANTPTAPFDGVFVTTGTALAVAPEAGNTVLWGTLAQGSLNYENTLYDNVANFSWTHGTIDYASNAIASGCQRCHGTPFLKEGYRGLTHDITGVADFVACKACHFDTRPGGHQDWARLADDPWSVASAAITSAQLAKYAYTASVMNDVHMSHAMELGYPQSMSNCVTCHAGKLTAVLAPANFTIQTCRSCHPVTGPADSKDRAAGRAPPLLSIMPAASHPAATVLDRLYADSATAPKACTDCHDGSTAPTFATIHNNGYDAAIYDSAGTAYSSIFQVTIGDAVQSGSTVTISFTASKTGGLPALDPTTVDSIVPTVLVGLYGYDTKDFIVDPHTKVNNIRQLEWVWGDATHPRFKNAAKSGSTYTVDVGLGDWATMLASTVTRFEVAVLAKVKDPAANVLVTNAPSKTFWVGSGTLSTETKPAIVAEASCNKCHEAMAFHYPEASGNIVVCRLCHNVRTGAAHLEMQSRNIDSYVHAIHEFQGFDIQGVDFTNKLKAMRFYKQQNDGFPNGGVVNCRACHVARPPGQPVSYDPPANDASLPSIQSVAANIAVRQGWKPGSTRPPYTPPTFTQVTSNIGPIPSFVTGAGSRACGGCHRAYPIKSNKGAALAAFDEHVNTMGFLIPSAGATTLDAAIRDVMVFFR